MSGTGLTFNAGSSTIKFTDASATNVTFTGDSLTYNNVWFSRGSSTATNTIQGSNIFNDFKDDGTAAHSDAFTNGTTQTVTTFSVNGSSTSNRISLNSTSNGSAWNISTATSRIDVDYVTLRDSHANQANTWFANYHSIDAGGNTNWFVFPHGVTIKNATIGNAIINS